MTIVFSQRAATSSQPEDMFVELFTQVFGLEKTQLLVPEHPVADIYGNQRFIDFALKSAGRLIAFEVDGPAHYGPPDFSLDKFEDDLLRQNSLIHQGWQVFRWSDRELAERAEQIKEQLSLFLESVPGLLEMDDFLPRQSGASIDLRLHQQDALNWLESLRAELKTIALLEHATGSGKTIIAIADARRVGGPVLYVAHRNSLVEQTARKLKQLWPEASHGRIMGRVYEPDREVVCASIQTLKNRLNDLKPETFRYLIVDEAHHAAAESYQMVLRHFRPLFTLGLTATPERLDGKPILEIFRDAAHRLSLKEAIEKGELAPIRCVRVKTNIDLSRVRFNEVQYNRQDLEQRIQVPARNQLIVDTYMEHVPNRKGVTFCVNVRHGEELAALFQQRGIPARSVSGAMRSQEREDILARFARGDLRMLCACDILNEGWDCPDVEVLLMARPTLSKIIYMQQLGRGTRKAPGKESLIVFDFIDNAGRYNASWNTHRMSGKTKYRPGGMVIGTREQMAKEQEKDVAPATILNLGVWAEDLEEVDIFDWQSVSKDMLSVSDLELRLATSEGFLRGKILKGELEPDHTLEIGTRRYFYFNKERQTEIREQFGLVELTAKNIRERFMVFCDEMDMAASYKPVLLDCLLECANDAGVAHVSEVTRAFRDFYLNRQTEGKVVEKPSARMARVDQLSDADIQQLMLQMPFRKFAQRGFLDYGRDVSRISFDKRLWKRLTEQDLKQLRETALSHIERYFSRLEQTEK